MAIITTWGFNTFSKSNSLLEKMSWDTISNISRLGLARNYFNIGDEKTIYINEEPYTAHIIGFDYDTIVDSEKDKYGRNTAGITFQLKNVLNARVGNSDHEYTYNTTYSWEDTNIKQFLDNQVIKNIDNTLLDKICTVNKEYEKAIVTRSLKTFNGESAYYYNLSKTRYNTEQKIFLLHSDEISLSSEYNITPYEYFTNAESRIKKINDSNCPWWIRNITPSNKSLSTLKPSLHLYMVRSNGEEIGICPDPSNVNYHAAYISFAFCV